MMKRIRLLLSIVAMGLMWPLAAQNTFSVGELNPYFSEYLRPMSTGLAVGMGQGWVHDAKPHKVLGFDIKFTAAVVEIPTSVHNFNGTALSEMDNAGYALQQEGNALSFDRDLPTIVSSSVADYGFKKSIGEDVSVDVPLLDGLDFPYAGNVALQVAVGLPKNTELMVRFVPDMSSTVNEAAGIDAASVSELNMWGLGVKHDIKQWIPVISKLPVLQVSAMLAYSEFNLGIISNDLALNPTELITGSSVINDPYYDNDRTIYDQQGFGINMSSMTGAILVGADIPVLKPYIGIGFNRYAIDAGLRGNFPVIEVLADDVVDVVDIEKDALNVSDNQTMINFQVGLNIKLAILNIHAQYTLQEYSMLSAGISLGIR